MKKNLKSRLFLLRTVFEYCWDFIKHHLIHWIHLSQMFCNIGIFIISYFIRWYNSKKLVHFYFLLPVLCNLDALTYNYINCFVVFHAFNKNHSICFINNIENGKRIFLIRLRKFEWNTQYEKWIFMVFANNKLFSSDLNNIYITRIRKCLLL